MIKIYADIEVFYTCVHKFLLSWVVCRHYKLHFGFLSDVIMAKRVADTYLTDRNFDDDIATTEEVCMKYIYIYILLCWHEYAC